ncbi:lmo0937 family membrane protein [Horticoccus sp. 23ND18S-11]|uniref:lmo0937 family membrane protein n=1 Tax=Horticoccus sp. 23ND18S-11 TaxID=3391832 RepID=UPI0039C8D6CA
MLETIAIILVLLWLAGIVSAYTLNGYLHLLLVAAFVLIILRLFFRGKDPLK